MAVLELEKLPTGYLSHSAISKMRRCPEAYRRHYVALELEAMGSPAVLGMAIHEAIEWFLRARMAGSKPDQNGLFDRYTNHSVDATIARWERGGGIEWKRGENGTTIHDDGMRALAAWYDQSAREHGTDAELPPIGRNLEPERVEDKFEVHFENYSWWFTGRLDLYTRQHVLADLKTTKRKTAENQAALSDQLTFEQMACENHLEMDAAGQMTLKPIPVAGLEVHQLVIGKKRVEVVVHRAAPREQGEISAALRDVAEVARMIEARQFIRVRDYQTCSWCAYLPACDPAWDRVRALAKEAGEKEAAE